MRVDGPGLALLVLLGLAGGPAPARAQAPDPPPDPLADIVGPRVRAVMDSAGLPGVAIAIVRRDTVLHAAGFGVADRTTGRPVTPQTSFQIGSTTKSFTTTLLAILAERGVLGLDDPVSRWLPPDVDVPRDPTGPPITLRHLALHTSGLPRQPPTLRRSDGDAPVLAFTHFELLQSIEAARLEYPTGKGWQYSNFGYSVLGHALERASGTPYETLLRRELFLPLGMSSSTVTLWPRDLANLARPYYANRESGELEDYTPWDTEAMAPASGIVSTALDLARYLSFHLGAHGGLGPPPATGATDGLPGDAGPAGSPDGAPGPIPDGERRDGAAGGAAGGKTGTLASASVVRGLHEPQVRVNERLSYALGWLVREETGFGRVLEHGGEVDGYTSYLAFAPESGIGVVVLANVGDAPASSLGDWILRQAIRSVGG